MVTCERWLWAPYSEIFFEQALDGGGEGVAALARGKNSHAVPQFCFAHRGEVDLGAVLLCQPSLDLFGRARPQEFREDVGVEDDHRGWLKKTGARATHQD